MHKSVQKAWFERDAVAYVDACVRDRIPIADEYLYEQYLAEKLIKKNSSLENFVSADLETSNFIFPQENSIESLYSHLTQIALARFPQDVSDKGLRRRAHEINEAGNLVGYHLKPYSRLSRNELWIYLTGEVRKQVEDLARQNCPNELINVKARNAKLKEQEKYLF